MLRQMVAPFLFALGALTSIMLLNQVARRFGALVGKGLPWTVIAEVFGLSIPFIVAITLPMAVLMAVLYARGQVALPAFAPAVYNGAVILLALLLHEQLGVGSLVVGVVLVAYCLWAFERADIADVAVPWYQISIVPFATAVLRYAQLLEAGEGGAPEDLVLRDHMLLAAGAVWAVLFGLGVLVA